MSEGLTKCFLTGGSVQSNVIWVTDKNLPIPGFRIDNGYQRTYNNSVWFIKGVVSPFGHAIVDEVEESRKRAG